MLLYDTLWHLFSAIASFVVILSPLVFFHELGHYLVAKWCGIHVEEFSIGMGPRIFSWKDRAGTTWSLSWFLIGGYVRMLGDGDMASSTTTEVEPHHRSKTMAGKTPLQRIMVALAGPAANYLLAFVVWMGLFTTMGQSWHKPVVQMSSSSYAYQMGMKPKDRITHLRGGEQPEVSHPIPSFEQLLNTLSQQPATKPLHLDVQRPDVGLLTITIPPQPQAQGTWLGKLGIQLADQTPFYKKCSIPQAFTRIMEMLNPITMIKGLKMDSMGGPIAIAQHTQSIWQGGWAQALFLMATLSVGLGFFNLLPLPILDGGLVFIELIQWVVRRPLSAVIRHYLSLGAAIAIGGWMLFLSWKDILRIPLIANLLGVS